MRTQLLSAAGEEASAGSVGNVSSQLSDIASDNDRLVVIWNLLSPEYWLYLLHIPVQFELAIHLADSLADQVRSLLAAVGELQAEVKVLRRENAELRQQFTDLTREVGYWKSRHADTVQRNVKLQAQLDQANAEIRQLKAERFGKRSEKQTSADRSNELLDPDALATALLVFSHRTRYSISIVYRSQRRF